MARGRRDPSTETQVFDVRGTLSIPIFQGGAVHGELLQADARLKQSQQRLDNLRAQIDADVRTALLNLSPRRIWSMSLAHIVSPRRRCRSRATVSARRHRRSKSCNRRSRRQRPRQYICSLYSYNFAKISLVRALGLAEGGVKKYFGGK